MKQVEKNLGKTIKIPSILVQKTEQNKNPSYHNQRHKTYQKLLKY